jgi:hypothetical protein
VVPDLSCMARSSAHHGAARRRHGETTTRPPVGIRPCGAEAGVHAHYWMIRFFYKIRVTKSTIFLAATANSSRIESARLRNMLTPANCVSRYSKKAFGTRGFSLSTRRFVGGRPAAARGAQRKAVTPAPATLAPTGADGTKAVINA